MPKTNFKADEPLLLSRMNALVQDTQILQAVGDSTTDIISQKAATAAFTHKESAEGEVKYYFCKNINLTVSGGTHVLCGCSGTLNVSGKNAYVYISNSPRLTLNGKTEGNWRNIFIDGKADFKFRQDFTVTNTNTNDKEFYSGKYLGGDNFTLYMDSYYTPVTYLSDMISNPNDTQSILISVGQTFWNSPSDCVRAVIKVNPTGHKLFAYVSKFTDSSQNAPNTCTIRGMYLWREVKR